MSEQQPDALTRRIDPLRAANIELEAEIATLRAELSRLQAGGQGVAYRCADCKATLRPGYTCDACDSFEAEEIPEDHPPAAPACRSQSAESDAQAGLISTGETQQPAAPAPYLDQLIGDLLMPLPAFTARELQSLHRRAAEILQLSRSVNANKHPPAPALVPLTRIDELAKVYAKSYASPHHFTIDCEGVRNIINGLTAGEPKKDDHA